MNLKKCAYIFIIIALNTPIEKLPRVGPKSAPKFKKLGILTVRDLLFHFPNRYEDYSQTMDIAGALETLPEQLQPGKKTARLPITIMGEVVSIDNVQLWRYRRSITKAIINDGTEDIQAVWFNQPYIADQLKVGTQVSLSGKISIGKQGPYLSNPSYEKSSNVLTHTAGLVPIYPETDGITSKYLRFLIKPLLPLATKLVDPLPVSILKEHKFPSLKKSLQDIHFPKDLKATELAKKRFAFEQMFLFQIRALRDRRQMKSLSAPCIEFDQELIAKFVKNLPFPLTNDQRVATYEILKDLERDYPMNRLLNGDVGSGKTVVALIAAYQTIQVGYQIAFMAPTEILAKQHYETFRQLLKNQNVKIGLLTGSEARQYPVDQLQEEKITKKLMHKKIVDGEIDLIIGTHAVIQKDVKFAKLGLVIIDEQHRFGVKQRMKLVKASKIVPHLLSMTATPIPRTLALTIYGDLDISLIKEKPKRRQEIKTKVVTAKDHKEGHEFVRSELRAGRQAFVICPRIEVAGAKEKEDKLQKGELSIHKQVWADVKAVTEEYERLAKQIFPEFKVAMLHGKLKSEEKNQIMSDFKDKKYDLLVSTSVIEVGVDVPNASVMLIRSPERFGLAQLHQFRGRVGRGEHQSHCLLFSDSDFEYKRLTALEKTASGFELAEYDLKLRGPGEFVGTTQSGVPDIAMSSLTDLELIKKARNEARELLKSDPALEKHPTLLTRLSEMQRLVHFE